jgi:hypothetical protein
MFVRCPYSDHGHCGFVDGDGRILNDASVAQLADIALFYAHCGADIIAPSDMMDGRIRAIKSKLHRSLKIHHFPEKLKKKTVMGSGRRSPLCRIRRNSLLRCMGRFGMRPSPRREKAIDRRISCRPAARICLCALPIAILTKAPIFSW